MIPDNTALSKKIQEVIQLLQVLFLPEHFFFGI